MQVFEEGTLKATGMYMQTNLFYKISIKGAGLVEFTIAYWVFTEAAGWFLYDAWQMACVKVSCTTVNASTLTLHIKLQSALSCDESRRDERNRKTLKKRHYLQEWIKERQKTSAILLYNKKLTLIPGRFFFLSVQNTYFETFVDIWCL